MPYRIFNQKDAVFLANSFEKNGLASSDHVDISVVFRERYSQEFLSLTDLKPFLVKITPAGGNQNSFLSLIFGKHDAQVIRFCSKNYHCKAIEIIDLKNIWAVPYDDDMMKIEINNKQFVESED